MCQRLLCNKYNSEDGCNRPNCPFIHQTKLNAPCQFYYSSECRLRDHCKKIHSLKRYNQFNNQRNNPPLNTQMNVQRPLQRDTILAAINDINSQIKSLQAAQLNSRNQQQPVPPYISLPTNYPPSQPVQPA